MSQAGATSLAAATSDLPLARRLAAGALGPLPADARAVGKLKTCLFDLIGCAFESRDLPWARQAAEWAARVPGPAAVLAGPAGIGAAEAAFASSVAGHGLVREDMHAGSVSHIGIVVLPTLLAAAAGRAVAGRRFVEAAIVGYEVSGRIGRALVDSDFARTFRPTSFVGPLGATLALARMLDADEDVATSALALAANTLAGFNQWPHGGADEMYFEPAFAARNAITACDLAMLGARASERALDGEAGLFAAYGRPLPELSLFPGGAVELNDVFNKALPLCNFAQTPCQAALDLKKRARIDAHDIRAIEVRATRAALEYPGCDWPGPWRTMLDAKMSIQYAVAAALLHGRIDRHSHDRLDDPALSGLAAKITLREDAGLTAAFPAKQGAAVTVTLADGTSHISALDTVRPATAEEVRARFVAAVSDALGSDRARRIEDFIDRIEDAEDVGQLGHLSANERE